MKKILVIKNKGNARVGDLAEESGWDGKKHQFHSTYIQPSYNREYDDGGTYWTEFLDEDSYIVLNKQEKFYQVVFGNYEPKEVDSTWETEEDAWKRATELGGMWTVEEMYLSDKAHLSEGEKDL